MKTLSSPIYWLGGKGRMKGKLLPLIEERKHKIYVEPFGGGAAILLAKEPSMVEVYNDIDNGLVNFFKVLADTKLFDQFYKMVSILPYSRALYYEYKKGWVNEKDLSVKAAKWFIVARQSFSGNFNNWGYKIKDSVTYTWLNCIDKLPGIHHRLQKVLIECSDWRSIIERFDSDDTLFYLDPPYIRSTRICPKRKYYSFDLSSKDHEDLINIVFGIKGQVIFSGYENSLYETLTSRGWVKYKFNTICNAAGRTKDNNLRGQGSLLDGYQRIECIWATPIRTHKLNTIF